MLNRWSNFFNVSTSWTLPHPMLRIVVVGEEETKFGGNHFQVIYRAIVLIRLRNSVLHLTPTCWKYFTNAQHLVEVVFPDNFPSKFFEVWTRKKHLVLTTISYMFFFRITMYLAGLSVTWWLLVFGLMWSWQICMPLSVMFYYSFCLFLKTWRLYMVSLYRCTF